MKKILTTIALIIFLWTTTVCNAKNFRNIPKRLPLCRIQCVELYDILYPMWEQISLHQCINNCFYNIKL